VHIISLRGDYLHNADPQRSKFYDHPSLTRYKYFWRLEPDIEFICAVPYDPFTEMRAHGKKYGYTVALWEVGETAHSLFRFVANYKVLRNIPSNSIWKAMVDVSWAPFPIRWLLARFLDHRDASGDAWNHCHFWSNFEIADLDWFRSKEYRDFFDYLDRSGGFYYERWGDAPIHSLAAALLLEPHELHRFEDFGYSHLPFWVCLANAWKKQLPESNTLGGGLGGGKWSVERENGAGCRCNCPSEHKRANFPGTCFAKFKKALKPRKAPLR
jgi:mannosyltransferase